MTVWHWVRHGPTHQKAFCGWRDVPADLSDGPRLARLNEALPQGMVLVSSDLVRATMTADAIAGTHSRQPASAQLREFHFGEWEGLDFAEVSARHPDLSRAFWEDPGDVAPPGGESWNQLAVRVNAYVDQMNLAHPTCSIIAVAHFGVILTQVQRALNISPYEALAQDIANLSITELRFDAGWSAHRINHIP